MKLFLSLLFIIPILGIFAQEQHRLAINNIESIIRASSVNFNNGDSIEFYCPKQEKGTSIYRSTIWMGGIDQNNQLRFSGNTVYGIGDEYSLGPIPNDSASSYLEFNKVFGISQNEINKFRTYISCFLNPLCDENINFAGYNIPDVIQNWPAHGDTSKGQSFNLAPFVDTNNDGIYTPQIGDYPCIKGEKAVYFILNDSIHDHQSQGRKIGVEIHVMAYAFNNGVSEPIKNTLFYSYKIINKSVNNFTDFKIGIYNDFDIGFSENDLPGTFVEDNSVFMYNGTPNDVGGNLALDSLVCAQGMTILNHPISNSFMIRRSDFWSTNYDPEIASEYYNNLNSKHKNGSSLTYGNTGQPYNYIYPNTPPNGFAPWTAITDSLQPFDYRILGASTIPSFNSGDTIDFDVAYVWSRSNPPHYLNSVTNLQIDIQEVQQFYDTQSAPCYYYNGQPVLIEEQHILPCKVYPNPTKNYITFEFQENVSGSIEIYNLLGALIQKHPINGLNITADISYLPKGIYTYRIQTVQGSSSGKIIKE